MRGWIIIFTFLALASVASGSAHDWPFGVYRSASALFGVLATICLLALTIRTKA